MLEVGVVSVAAGVSDIRADGVAEWIDPAPIKDTAAGPRMRVTVAAGCPQSDNGDVGVSNTGDDLSTMLLPTAAPRSGLICEYAGMNGKKFGLISSTPLNQAAAVRLASAAANSSLSHLDNLEVNCPMDDGSMSVLAFTYPGRADVDLWDVPRGCQSLSNGFITASPADALIELVNPAASGPPFPPASASR